MSQTSLREIAPARDQFQQDPSIRLSSHNAGEQKAAMSGSAQILHVTEAFGGGVSAVMAQYAYAMSELKHHALVASRAESVPLEDRIAFSSLTSKNGMLNLAREYMNRRTGYSIIHGHSSKAGVLVRATTPPRSARVIYSPHALAYTSRAWYEPRAWTRHAEVVLRAKADAYGAVSSYEASQLMRLGIPAQRITIVPHFVEVQPTRPETARNIVAAVGRVCAQKNPRYFVDVVRVFRAMRPKLAAEIRFIWIGGGDVQSMKILEEEGISVTGWLERSEVATLLRDKVATVVHGARYEGLPLALLEAMSIGVPVIAHEIPSLRDLRSVALAKSSAHAARILTEMIVDQEEITSRSRRSQKEIGEKFNVEKQRRALTELYGGDW